MLNEFHVFLFVESIVKGLRADKEEDVKESMDRADELISKLSEVKKNFSGAGDNDDKDLPKTKTGKIIVHIA